MGLQVAYLLFADDTLIFCKDSRDQSTYLCWLLMWFETFSGLKINLDKSELTPIGRVDDIEALTTNLGCKVGSLPTTYLGLPLGALITSQWELGMVWRSVLGGGWLFGGESTSPNKEKSHLLEALCQVYEFTFFL